MQAAYRDEHLPEATGYAFEILGLDSLCEMAYETLIFLIVKPATVLH
jgi:hypothetical protein